MQMKAFLLMTVKTEEIAVFQNKLLLLFIWKTEICPEHETKKSISNKLSGQIGKEQHFVKAIPKRVNNFLSAKLGGERGKFDKARVGQCFHIKRKTFPLITFLCNKLLV